MTSVVEPAYTRAVSERTASSPDARALALAREAAQALRAGHPLHPEHCAKRHHLAEQCTCGLSDLSSAILRLEGRVCQ